MLRRGVDRFVAGGARADLRGISSLPALWSGRAATTLLLSALADDTPALRRQGLTLGASRTGLWSRPDALEHLKRLLVDPDAQVRELALSVVEPNRLLAARKGEQRHVGPGPAGQGASRRPGPEIARARPARRQWHRSRPRSVADVQLGRSRLLSFSTFRHKVNPLFYRAGDDQAGLRKLPRQPHDPAHRRGRRRPENTAIEQLMINYNSALKVVNLGEPEASLILRKPRSPHGAGGADPSSPTGLTHVGGSRWESTESPAYRAILDWIREASLSASGQAWTGNVLSR